MTHIADEPSGQDELLPGFTRNHLAHLEEQFRHARPILFTGAGFSVGAANRAGEPIPMTGALRNEIFDLCYPGEKDDGRDELEDLFDVAVASHRKALDELLQRRLTVASSSIPAWYRYYFDAAWHRAYTLNVDDLAPAAGRQFKLRRRPSPISATSTEIPAGAQAVGRRLEVVHLNGMLADGAESLTFSRLQYARRMNGEDMWYASLVAELATRSVVFVGSSLNEPGLWAYVEMRKSRGPRGARELRPRSYLVTRSLNRAKAEMLQRFNIVHVAATAEEFATVVLSELTSASELGHRKLEAQHARPGTSPDAIPAVADLFAATDRRTEFLLGAEPDWADIKSGRAVQRESDTPLLAAAKSALGGKSPRWIAVDGTAGTGKSTSLMRLAASLSADGREVAWIGQNTSIGPSAVRDFARQSDRAQALVIDDADRFGAELGPLALDCSDSLGLVVTGARTSAMYRYVQPAAMGASNCQPFTIPLLADSDIEGLLSALEADNKLGELEALPHAERRKRLKDKCGSQLLVAMIEVTSGERFEDKVFAEWNELVPDQQFAYAIVAIAWAFRVTLSVEEVAMAAGDTSNTVLNALEKMVVAGLLNRTEGDHLRVRHRVVAEVLRDRLRTTGQVVDALRALARVAAAKVRRDMRKTARPVRLLRQITNHDFLQKALGSTVARTVYEDLEDLLPWSHHYWLQRGCLELEAGEFRRARLYLSQARAKEPDDVLVGNEWAALLLKQAWNDPGRDGAADEVEQALQLLAEGIAQRGNRDPYPYHILARNGLMWARHGIADRDERKLFLERVLVTAREGQKKHPHNEMLLTACSELERELLMTRVKKD